MSGTRCLLLWASVMSHVQGTVRPQSPGQRQPTAPMQWSQATAQISTSSRMRPARPPISRGSLLKPPDWLSQTIASSVDTQQHQVYCTILHHNCKFLLRETISSLDLKLDRDLYFKDAKGLLFKDGLDGPLDGSQNETAIFLKTLNVNTMLTNTAGKIILAKTIFVVAMEHGSRFNYGWFWLIGQCVKAKLKQSFVKTTDIYRMAFPGRVPRCRNTFWLQMTSNYHILSMYNHG